MKKSLLRDEDIKMINLISNIEYNVSMEKDKRNKLSEKEKNIEIFNHFMDNFNPNCNSPEQKILNYFIEDK